MVDLRSDAAPVLHDLNISGIPPDFSFHPHGLHLDNATQRLFAVCHAKTVPLNGRSITNDIIYHTLYITRYNIAFPFFQNGAKSGFEMCFAPASQCRGSQPKHVSNPDQRSVNHMLL